MNHDLDTLVSEAVEAANRTEGWDFSYVRGRRHLDSQPWSWSEIVASRLGGVHQMLDMDTGGGEVLLDIHRHAESWPDQVRATEGYPPNVSVAARNLAKIGTTVVPFETHDHLPFDDGTFDLITNRHGGFSTEELWRILKPGGVFLTQQISFSEKLDVNELLGGPGPSYERVTFGTFVGRFPAAGFAILDQRQFTGSDIFDDIGALVFVLTMASWEVADFAVEKYRNQLLRLHERIERDGPIDIGGGSWLLAAEKPPRQAGARPEVDG